MTKTETNEAVTGLDSLDHHWLYEQAVQSPDHDIPFFEKIYKKKNDKMPRVFREDFCGTALLSATWVKRHPENRAIGIDLDESVLDWARTHNQKPLGDDADRLTLLCSDVREISEPKADVIAALNFSYFIFKEREDLIGYFRSARLALNDGGIFALDIFGGWESQMEKREKTRNEGFTYTWEQKRFDPVTNHTRFHIHFTLHKGGSIKKAFTYDWRMWSIPEIRDILNAAGFEKTRVYWEGVDKKTGEVDGDFRPVDSAKNCPAWNALIISS